MLPFYLKAAISFTICGCMFFKFCISEETPESLGIAVTGVTMISTIVTVFGLVFHFL